MKIKTYNNFEKVDKKLLRDLVKNAFNDKKTLTKNYFNSITPKYITICEDEGKYIGAAIVEKTEYKFDYLDKFVVAKSVQKNGVGQKIWSKVKKKSKKLCWRMSKSNPIGFWYFKNSTGHHKQGKWTVFWLKLNVQDVKNALNYVISKKESLKTV